MYLQIIEQIKRRISLGDWPAGHKLPSIRELAVSIKVSVITVKRAYQELESQGVIYTQPGKGSFVSNDSDLDKQLREAEMNNKLLEVLKIAESLGMSVEDIAEQLSQLKQDQTNSKQEPQ
ncbi:MAG: GntR family transcriptional regulator [Alteromonadaceae bacterium]|nr:GntR family transcriptional regulator [Alteromonadaceae bacterium]